MMRTRLRFSVATALALACTGPAPTPAADGRVFVDVRPIRSTVHSPINGPGFEGTPQLSPDGRTLYFVSIRPSPERLIIFGNLNRLDIYVATRKNVDGPFDHVENLHSINTPFVDSSPHVTLDGLRLYFTSSRPDPGSQGDWDLWVARRDATTDPFGDVKNLGFEINSPATDGDMAISCDEEVLVFASSRSPSLGGFFDLWMANFDADGALVGNLVNLGVEDHCVNSEYGDGSPGLSCDALTLFTCGNSYLDLSPPRPEGYGGDDLWMATRPDRSAPFCPLENLKPPASSAFHENYPSPSFDWPDSGSLLLFGSDRPHPLARSAGDIHDVFQATWLALRDGSSATFSCEPPRESGALNCGGWQVDTSAEIGLFFERDRFFEDRIHWEGNPDDGWVITTTTLGHVRIEDPSGGFVRGADNPRSVDVSGIPGAGEATASLFETCSLSPDRLHYKALVKPGRYDVSLFFAEGSPDAVNGFGQGARMVTVSLVGETILENWSAAAAGGSPGGSGDPSVPCNAVLDAAVVRRFQVDVPDEDPGPDRNEGTLEIIVEGSRVAGLVSEAALSAFSFERVGNLTGEPATGDIEILEIRPENSAEAEALERARGRWLEDGELYINCGGPILSCNATENPAPAAAGEDGTGEPVVWLSDLPGALPRENEFFSVNGGNAYTTDMGFWDARGTEEGVDQNDRIFHTQRQENMVYEILADEGTYDVTLYFANASSETAGTAQRFFQVEIAGERQGGFEHCEFLGRDEEGNLVKSPVFDWDTLYDPVDHADQLYSPESPEGQTCQFAACEAGGIDPYVATAAVDPDGDGVPAEAECGNAAATALRYKVEVGGEPLTVALTAATALEGEPAPPEWRPILSALRVRRLPPAPVRFKRGDSNTDGSVNLADPVYTLIHLFLKGPASTCVDAADADDSDQLNLTDAVYTLLHLFLSGPAPKPPFGICGPDPTSEPDELKCESYPPCAEP